MPRQDDSAHTGVATLPRTQVMGILNVTPDSFSDGGRWIDQNAAFDHALAMREQGADIIDIGGESTRPGAERVSPAEEQRRIVDLVRRLTNEGVCVSVDTMRASTARLSIEAGAQMINDVSGGLADAEMASVVADSEATFIAMHWRAHSTHMDALDDYEDVVAEVAQELAQRRDALVVAGIEARRIVLDPGLGFSKVGPSNWPLVAQLDTLHQLGQPVLIGHSRKRFLGAVLRHDDSPENRDWATAALTTLVAHYGVWAVRVHNVRAAIDAISVVSTWKNAQSAQL